MGRICFLSPAGRKRFEQETVFDRMNQRPFNLLDASELSKDRSERAGLSAEVSERKTLISCMKERH